MLVLGSERPTLFGPCGLNPGIPPGNPPAEAEGDGKKLLLGVGVGTMLPGGGGGGGGAICANAASGFMYSKDNKNFFIKSAAYVISTP